MSDAIPKPRGAHLHGEKQDHRAEAQDFQRSKERLEEHIPLPRFRHSCTRTLLRFRSSDLALQYSWSMRFTKEEERYDCNNSMLFSLGQQWTLFSLNDAHNDRHKPKGPPPARRLRQHSSNHRADKRCQLTASRKYGEVTPPLFPRNKRNASIADVEVANAQPMVKPRNAMLVMWKMMERPQISDAGAKRLLPLVTWCVSSTARVVAYMGPTEFPRT
jgi:hypothetical protein